MTRPSKLSPVFASAIALASCHVIAQEPSITPINSLERTSRIIGGTTAPAEKWPFMAAVVSKGYKGGKGQFCGASFIGSRYVLTAAHCLDATLGDDIEVIIGQQDLSAATSEQRLSVRKVYIHEEYDGAAQGNDIAILELSEAYEGPAVTLAEFNLRDELAAGQALTVMGWGDQDPTDEFRKATQLQQVNVELIDQQVCKNVPALGYDKITENAFCAGVVQGGKDSCQGDSGGPIVVMDGGQYKQLGIVSWGDGCAVAGKYGVYANVSYYANWIAAKTKGLSYDQHVYAGILGKGAQSTTLTYQNNTESELILSNLTRGQGVTVDNNSCIQPLPVGDKCEVTVSYNVAGDGDFSFNVTMDSSQGIGSVSSQVHYQSYPVASSPLSDWVSEQVPNQQLSVFSQANGWQRTSTGIVSSVISDDQYSTFAISGIAKGQVALDLAVSSEEDYDELKVFVNGRLELSASGEQEGTVSFVLPREKNVVEVVYVKDKVGSGGEDRGYLNGIRYSSSLILPSVIQPSFSTGSGGGSLGWLSLIALLVLARRKQS
ncbi:serine protease [Vibrio sp. 05-20-BW147]|uniref:S1 family peptidase n=1 Tax=Vibrio sp. 05-20-BW147 TaxID=2575834 RepID=UPI001593C999|nr:serine protease [Vibrio sp. 05-20-BW147]NVC62047.1 serine protease [Vibrio sp. 05-20-BW147]